MTRSGFRQPLLQTYSTAAARETPASRLQPLARKLSPELVAEDAVALALRMTVDVDMLVAIVEEVALLEVSDALAPIVLKAAVLVAAGSVIRPTSADPEPMAEAVISE